MRPHSTILASQKEGRTHSTIIFYGKTLDTPFEIACPGLFVQKNQGIILSNVPGKSLGLNFTLQDVCCSSQRSALTAFIKLLTCSSFVIRRWYELKLFCSGHRADLAEKQLKELEWPITWNQKETIINTHCSWGAPTLLDTTQECTIC